MTDEDIERLEALLGEDPHARSALSADALQGMFVALAMGPDAQPSPRWLEMAFGGDAATPPAGDSAEITDLMTRFRDDTARQHWEVGVCRRDGISVRGVSRERQRDAAAVGHRVVGDGDRAGRAHALAVMVRRSSPQNVKEGETWLRPQHRPPLRA